MECWLVHVRDPYGGSHFYLAYLSCSFGVVMIFHVSWHAGTPTINNIVAIHAITLRVWLILSKQSYHSLNHHYGTLSLLLLWEAKSVSSASLICRSVESAAPAWRKVESTGRIKIAIAYHTLIARVGIGVFSSISVSSVTFCASLWFSGMYVNIIFVAIIIATISDLPLMCNNENNMIAVLQYSI